MSHAEPQEQGERLVLHSRTDKAEIKTADAQAARNAGASEVKAIQALNPNRHNGSAGGDQLESVQLIALDHNGKQKVVAERPKEHRQEPTVTTGELRNKEKASDTLAKSLVPELNKTARLSQLYRDGPITEVLKKAEIINQPEQRGKTSS